MGYNIVSSNDVNLAENDRALGVLLPFSGPNGIFNTAFTTIDQTISNLKNLLLTRLGERIFQPTFGTNLSALLFEQDLDLIKQSSADIITAAISYWLPYINIIDIEIKTTDDDPLLDHNVMIKLTFNVDGTSISTTPDAFSTITIFSSENQLIVK